MKKKPLADRRNKESETVSPGGKRALDKRMEAHTKENAVGCVRADASEQAAEAVNDETTGEAALERHESRRRPTIE